MLLPIEALISSSEAKSYLALLQQANWLDGKQTAGGQAALVKANLQANDNDSQVLKVREALLSVLKQHPLFISAALPNQIFPPKFNCYRNGAYYGLHVDNSLMSAPDGYLIRTDISATLFLTPPESYQGGELIIETAFGAQAVKLNAGDMILYPSSSLHQVKPVVSGERVCAFFWVESLVRNAFQREQLFDLDQSIQTLTVERGGNDAEVRRLTGLYHNLLRSWAKS